MSGCAARSFAVPTDPGTPLPEFEEIFSGVTSACAGVRTLTAVLGLSGTAGDQRLRGRVVAGFERPDSMRLEGVAPFGQPVFILAARGDTAVLLLPRDRRVVRDASAREILGALTGVTLAPADLQAILTGCVRPAPQSVSGRLHAEGWASMELDGGATMYLRRPRGRDWEIRAARLEGWLIEYREWQGLFPSAVRLRSDSAPAVDITATLSQVDTNIDIDAAAFTVDVPGDASELSVQELRSAGPLRDDDR